MKRRRRRRFLQMAAGAVALLAASRIAWAQTYPRRPVRMIVGYPAGAATDLVGRLMGQWVSGRPSEAQVEGARAYSLSAAIMCVTFGAPSSWKRCTCVCSTLSALVTRSCWRRCSSQLSTKNVSTKRDGSAVFSNTPQR